MSDSTISYDPKDYYEKDLKDRFKENAEKYFDGLKAKANVDVEANKLTCNKIQKEVEINKAGHAKIKTQNCIKFLFISLIVIATILLIVSLVFTFSLNDSNIVFPILIGASILIIIGSLLYIFLVSNKKIKKLKAIDAENDRRLQKLCDEAYAQLKPLNDIFNYYDFNNIVKKTTDIFTLDDNLDQLKLLMVRNCYGLTNEPSNNESILGVMSGDIKTNPFIRIKVLEKTIYNKVYTGSIVIHWSERVSDGKGGSRYVTRTQTLTATISKPAPLFSNATYTIYGNEAAPDLVFSRQPSGLKINSSEDDIKKFVKDGEKKLEKFTQKSIKKGGTFQALANSEFESLFGAINRNNETQFRLLFTPLAQQNMVELITKSPYGDDFTFYKQKKINIVSSIHSRNAFSFNEEGFRKIYSYQELKTTYINTVCELFKSLYFDLAPILSIPLYQQTDAGIYDIKRNFLQHISDYEAESLVNSMNPSKFMPEEASTAQILKVKYNKTIKNADFFEVNSSSFKTINRVEYVSLMGGDGRLHNVPVYWVEYIPVNKKSIVSIRDYGGGESDFNNLNSSQEFINEYKKAFSFPIRFKNYIGFYDNGCYSYNDDYDDELTTIINKSISSKDRR